MLAVALFSFLLVSRVLSCFHNFEPWYNGICFRVGLGTTSYADAVEFCKNHEAHLPRIMNKEENDLFYSQILCKPSLSESCSDSWLDLKCDTNNRFVWGDSTPATYTNFRDTVDCDSKMKYAINSTDGKWIVVSPDTFQQGTCQQAAPLNKDKCRGFHPAAEPLGRHGDCYSVQYKNKWSVAEDNCIADGGHLSSIHSAKENQFIFDVVGPVAAAIHIGLEVEDCGTTTANSKYQWTDSSATSYTNFSPSATCDWIDKCVSILVTPLPSDGLPGQWTILHCMNDADEYPSVCVRPAVPQQPVEPAGCPAEDRVYNIGNYIVSPGFPSAGAAANCTYHVNVPAGKNVRLRPLSFEANRCCDSLLISNSFSNSEVWTGIHTAPSAVFSSPVSMRWTAASGVGVVGFRVLVEKVVVSCGTTPVQPNLSAERIVGGQTAVPYSWPSQVVWCSSGWFGGCSLECGGTVIDNGWVMTAAHCVYDDMNPKNYQVKAAIYKEDATSYVPTALFFPAAFFFIFN